MTTWNYKKITNKRFILKDVVKTWGSSQLDWSFFQILPHEVNYIRFIKQGKISTWVPVSMHNCCKGQHTLAFPFSTGYFNPKALLLLDWTSSSACLYYTFKIDISYFLFQKSDISSSVQIKLEKKYLPIWLE